MTATSSVGADDCGLGSSTDLNGYTALLIALFLLLPNSGTLYRGARRAGGESSSQISALLLFFLLGPPALFSLKRQWYVLPRQLHLRIFSQLELTADLVFNVHRDHPPLVQGLGVLCSVRLVGRLSRYVAGGGVMAALDDAVGGVANELVAVVHTSFLGLIAWSAARYRLATAVRNELRAAARRRTATALEADLPPHPNTTKLPTPLQTPLLLSDTLKPPFSMPVEPSPISFQQCCIFALGSELVGVLSPLSLRCVSNGNALRVGHSAIACAALAGAATFAASLYLLATVASRCSRACTQRRGLLMLVVALAAVRAFVILPVVGTLLVRRAADG